MFATAQLRRFVVVLMDGDGEEREEEKDAASRGPPIPSGSGSSFQVGEIMGRIDMYGGYERSRWNVDNQQKTPSSHAKSSALYPGAFNGRMNAFLPHRAQLAEIGCG